MTTSVLTLVPSPPDDGTTITCRAENQATKDVKEESIPMTIHCKYIPEIFIFIFVFFSCFHNY